MLWPDRGTPRRKHGQARTSHLWGALFCTVLCYPVEKVALKRRGYHDTVNLCYFGFYQFKEDEVMRDIHLNNLKSADIYGLTAEEFSLGRNNITVVENMIKAGIKVIQYREKDKEARDMYAECLKIKEMTTAAGVTFIVNDRIDLAMAVDADGVHIGQGDLPAETVRKLIGYDKILGLSTHVPAEAQQAVRSGIVDYIGVGPIFATKTKKDVSDPVGFDYLDYVVGNINLPFVAIGGIKVSNIRAVADHGAKLIAMVTEIVGAKDIVSRVKEIRAVMAG